MTGVGDTASHCAGLPKRASKGRVGRAPSKPCQDTLQLLIWLHHLFLKAAGLLAHLHKCLHCLLYFGLGEGHQGREHHIHNSFVTEPLEPAPG